MKKLTVLFVLVLIVLSTGCHQRESYAQYQARIAAEQQQWTGAGNQAAAYQPAPYPSWFEWYLLGQAFHQPTYYNFHNQYYHPRVHTIYIQQAPPRTIYTTRPFVPRPVTVTPRLRPQLTRTSVLRVMPAPSRTVSRNSYTRVFSSPSRSSFSPSRSYSYKPSSSYRSSSSFSSSRRH